MNDILERHGRFILWEDQTQGDLPFWGLVMSKMLVTNCIYSFPFEGFEYLAYSSLFRRLEEGEASPLYKIQTNEYNDIEAIEI